MDNTLGIVGGLGPEATAKIYLALVNKIATKTNQLPNIIINSVPITLSLDSKFILGKLSENEKQNLLDILFNACILLINGGSKFIIIPCNSAHIFLDKLKSKLKIPIISIVDATINEIPPNSKKVAVLATTSTIESRIYQNALKEKGIKNLPLDNYNQNRLSEIIIKITANRNALIDIDFIRTLINQLLNDCDSIVLGCTELSLIIEKEKNIIDSLDALQNEVIKYIDK